MVRSKHTVLRLLAVLLALALVAAACGGDSDDDAVDEPIDATGETQEDPDETDEAEEPPPDDGEATQETARILFRVACFVMASKPMSMASTPPPQPCPLPAR